ncbi:MAG: hypothetical protein K2P37_04785 [Oscillospiraceae bacterium]|jgi:hypothetical protein|nr:hypothetical protein [Oscillospiraceae bacterium]
MLETAAQKGNEHNRQKQSGMYFQFYVILTNCVNLGKISGIAKGIVLYYLIPVLSLGSVGKNRLSDRF